MPPPAVSGPQFPAPPPRRLLVLCGPAQACRAAARERLAAFAPAEVWWLLVDANGKAGLHAGDVPDGDPPAAASRPSRTALGRECAALVVDAHTGFDPDAVGQAGGALRGGGVLLLLAPPLADWPLHADPVRLRGSVHGRPPLGPDRYLARLARLIGTAGGATRVPAVPAAPAPPVPATTAEQAPEDTHAGCVPLPPLPPPAPIPAHPPDACASADQAVAVAALLKLAHGRAHRPLVLSADRGRGKSAALGLAAAHLLAAGWPRIVVTGPRLTAVAAVYAHAAAALPGATLTHGCLTLAGRTLTFAAPDALAAPGAEAVPLLFVDEAAALPAPLLARLLARHPRIAWASTVHGYEGSGRGFALRFRATLDAQAPGWRSVALHAPIRWPAGDPVEAALARWLLLAAEPEPDAHVAGLTAASVHIERLDRDRLASDEALLARVHGLLVAAHYRTTPLDLRHLLDGPNLRLYAARGADGALAGVLLAADEGGFDATLAAEVHAGRRRPRGHLIPQSLAQHLGVADGAGRTCARIVRIAVHAAARGRGLGRALLAALDADARAAGTDLVGTSFSAETGLLRFWARAGLAPVRVGSGHDTASGAPPLLLLRALSPAGTAMLATLRARFAHDLPLALADPLATLDTGLAAALLAAAGPPGEPDAAHDAATVAAYARGARDYASAYPALWRCARLALADPARSALLDGTDRELLLAKLVQHRPWAELASAARLSGRAAVEVRLRSAYSRLCAAHG